MKRLMFFLIVAVALFRAPDTLMAAIPVTEAKAEKMERVTDGIADTAYSAEYISATAADVPQPEPPTTWDWIVANWGKLVLLLAGIWEVVMRVFPTTADWSIVNRLLALLKWLADLIPNLSTRGGRHV